MSLLQAQIQRSENEDAPLVYRPDSSEHECKADRVGCSVMCKSQILVRWRCLRMRSISLGERWVVNALCRFVSGLVQKKAKNSSHVWQWRLFAKIFDHCQQSIINLRFQKTRVRLHTLLRALSDAAYQRIRPFKHAAQSAFTLTTQNQLMHSFQMAVGQKFKFS